MLDHVPARLRVIRVCRPRYGCRACGTIHQAPAPERPIAKGLATPGLLAHVLVAKYCDHLPLYRQSQIFARNGVELDRSTLANWVGGACWWLEPLQKRLAEHVFASTKLFADDTPVPVLDPGRGRTRTGRLWVYARDDRSWGGPAPPAALYLYSPDRKAERPAAHLAQFKGVIQVDGYAGFEKLAAGGDIQLAACWAHTRRKFYEVHQATASPIAEEMLRRIAALYTIEDTIRGQTAAARQVARHAKSLPLVDDLKSRLEHELHRVPPRSPLAEAIRYALSRWPELCRFLDDGRLELDTNTVERAIRPIALGRKNHPLRRLRRRRRALGHRRLPHRHRKAQRRRALRLPQGRPRAHDKRSPHASNRRTPPLELEAVRPPQLTDVRGMDASLYFLHTRSIEMSCRRTHRYGCAARIAASCSRHESGISAFNK